MLEPSYFTAAVAFSANHSASFSIPEVDQSCLQCLWQAIKSGELRAFRFGHLLSVTEFESADPAIVDHVGKHVRHDVSDANHQHTPLNHAIIAFADAVVHQQQSQAGPAENFFSDDRTREQHAEL